jgi:hypothetical protein
MRGLQEAPMLLKFLITQLRKFERGQLNRREVDQLISLAVENGLVWTWPGIYGISKAIERGSGGK